MNHNRFFDPEKNIRPVGIFQMMDEPRQPIVAVVAQNVPGTPAMVRQFGLSAPDLTSALGKNAANDGILADLKKNLAAANAGTQQPTPYRRPQELPQVYPQADFT